MLRNHFAIALAVGLAGCGGGPMVGQTQVVTSFGEVVRAHKALVVRSGGRRDVWSAEGKALVATLVPKLVALGYFSAVVDEAGTKNTSVELELEITLTDVVRVTDNERRGRGDAAGAAKVMGDVRLVDKATHAELGRASVSAGGYEGPHGGTTDDAIEEVARQIVQLVSRR